MKKELKKEFKKCLYCNSKFEKIELKKYCSVTCRNKYRNAVNFAKEENGILDSIEDYMKFFGKKTTEIANTFRISQNQARSIMNYIDNKNNNSISSHDKGLTEEGMLKSKTWSLRKDWQIKLHTSDNSEYDGMVKDISNETFE
jgi:hypothetical protein